MSGFQRLTSAVMAGAGLIPIVRWAGRTIKGANPVMPTEYGALPKIKFISDNVRSNS